ncbi:MAG TPA: polysaccharide deacetylase family protein [Stellaceae bacterium]|nr:polysaccharide deacetylase family protein [Stellaceae bacterium]
MSETATWPGGKRVAVLVSVLLENWTEGKSPTYFPRTTPLKPGAIDHGGVEWSHYGGREGIWRLLRVLERARVKATIFANALSAELYPEAVRAVIAAGHDLGAHGYAQDKYLSDLTVDEQQRSIRRALDILESQSGRRPQGWCSPVYSFTPETPELLVREGVHWHAEALDTSMPKLIETPAGPIVALPWSEFVDNRVLRASPRDYYDVYKDSFDYLYDAEPMGLLHLAVHSHFGGRPLIAAQVEKILRYVAGFPDVWVPRHAELVDWFLAARPGDLSYAKRFFK